MLCKFIGGKHEQIKESSMGLVSSGYFAEAILEAPEKFALSINRSNLWIIISRHRRYYQTFDHRKEAANEQQHQKQIHYGIQRRQRI